VRALSLIFNLFALCVIGFDAIVAGRFSLAQAILASTFAIGMLAVYIERPFWFRTLAMVPLSFVAIFCVVFLAMALYNPADYRTLQIVMVVVYLAVIAGNIWVLNQLAPRSDRPRSIA
jgi:uncharacterized membrane protein